MSIHTKALKQACSQLQLPFKSIGKTGVFLSVDINGTPFQFIANKMPLNTSIVAGIMEDKGMSYDLLSDVVKMPKTLSFLDPHVRELFQPYVTHRSLKEIVAACEAAFHYPMIIKRNAGSQGENVFKCNNKGETIAALEKIFDHHSTEYDYAALAQEYVEIDKEFRVTVLNKNIEIIYQKDNSQAQFTGNLSPLHWKGAKAVLIQDDQFTTRLAEFIQPIFTVLNVEYCGLDVAVDKQGQLWVFELNSHPAYDHLVNDTSSDILVELYRKILDYLHASAKVASTSATI